MIAEFIAPILPPVRGKNFDTGHQPTALSHVWPHGVTSINELLMDDERRAARTEELAMERFNAACEAVGC